AIALTLAAGVVGGFAARYVHLPLPWLPGALFTTMAPSRAGPAVRLIPGGLPPRAAVVGASTRRQITPSVVAALASLLPHVLTAVDHTRRLHLDHRRRHRRTHLYAAHRDRPRHRVLRHRARRRGGNDDHRPVLRRPPRAHHGRADDEGGTHRGVRAVPGDLLR